MSTESATYKLQSNQLSQACIVVRMQIICQSQCRITTHSILKSPTYELQSNQLRQACIVVRMEIICQSQCRNTTHPFLKSVTYELQLRQACIVVRMEIICQSQCGITPSSEIGDIRAAIESVAPSVHCRSDGNHLSVPCRNTHTSGIADIRAAIESIAPTVHCSSDGHHFSHNVETHPRLIIGNIRAAIKSVASSVHCRSDGNHLSVTMSKHNTPYSESQTYTLQSNQLRHACIVVRMEIICLSQRRNTTHHLLKSPTYVLQSNQLCRACVTAPGCKLSERMSVNILLKSGNAMNKHTIQVQLRQHCCNRRQRGSTSPLTRHQCKRRGRVERKSRQSRTL
jgi:hypothetical protein